MAAAVVLALAVAGAASGNAGTYAAFSDFDVLAENHAEAAQVAVRLPDAGGRHLDYPGLLPGLSRPDTLAFGYGGTVPGDLALELRPDGASPFCDQAGDGSWTAREGGALLLSVGTGWFDYCGLLSPGASVPLRAAVAPGADLAVDIRLQLATGTGYRYSELRDTDRLSLTARQTGVGAFTDFARGTIAIGTGTILPPIPAECGPVAGYQGVVEGTEGDDVIDAGNGKQIVLGFGGDDVLDGGNGKDCLVGGDGDDVLEGGNGKDVMVGGAGLDTCNGGHAPDSYSCELPAQTTAPPAPLLVGPPPAQSVPPPPDEGTVEPDVDGPVVDQPDDPQSTQPGPTDPVAGPTPAGDLPESPGDGAT